MPPDIESPILLVLWVLRAAGIWAMFMLACMGVAELLSRAVDRLFNAKGENLWW